AQKARIPAQVIDFIRSHHGRSTALLFYRSILKEHPDRESEIDKFTYPGPNPASKEGVALMMSDAVEAASRSLKERTGESIASLVNKIVDLQFTNGLYNEAPITLREVQMAREALIHKLMNIYHVRIEYPE
ncbi:MAG: hydrolase, partial [Bacteroidales bacterium]